MKYQAVIFDVSDTLVEYSPNYAQIYSSRLESLGFTVSGEKAREVSRRINWVVGEQTRKEQFTGQRLSQEEYQVLLDEAALSCVIPEGTSTEQYLRTLSRLPVPKQQISIIPGVIDVLSVLKGRYRLAIVSNHFTWLLDYLKEVGLAPFFETIVISDIVGVAKPDTRIMEIALKELGLRAVDCLYVGDHPYDVLCSKQAGMDCAWISDGNELPSSIGYKEDYRITTVSDLLNIL